MQFDVCCQLCHDFQADGCVGWTYNIHSGECQLRDNNFQIDADVTDINWVHADVEFEVELEFNPCMYGVCFAHFLCCMGNIFLIFFFFLSLGTSFSHARNVAEGHF